jgi:hypothetical protein
LLAILLAEPFMAQPMQPSHRDKTPEGEGNLRYAAR